MTKFFGITINGDTREAIRARLAQFLVSASGHHVVTLNPEMLVASTKKPAFHDVLSRSDLRVTDGFGIQLMARLTGQRVPDRITGSDIVEMICAHSKTAEKTVFLLGGMEGHAQRAAHALRDTYGIDVAHAHGGRVEKHNETWDMDPRVIETIKHVRPDVLLVALGHEKQETWIHDHLPELPSVRIAVGVGGVFAFLANDIPRAPRWMRRVGLEWLWRLIREPSRFKRILTAVVIFPWRVLTKNNVW